MKVLVVSPYYEPAHVYGGPSRSIPALCRSMACQGAEVTVFTTNANGARSLDVEPGVPTRVDGVWVTYFRRLTSARYFWSPDLASACVRHADEFDLVHSNGIFHFPALVASYAAKAKSIPLFVSLRGVLMPWALRQKRRKKELYLQLIGQQILHSASALHCTDGLEREALELLDVHKPVFVIPNGLDIGLYANLPSRGALRGRLGISDRANVILSLGRLHPGKRPDLALGAFAMIAAQFPEAELLFVGPDEANLKPELLDIARHANCDDRVHFTGLLEPPDVIQALADSDLMLMTSESENFGLAAAEAMAASLPLILSEQMGISHYVREAGAGEVVPLETKSIARALSRLLDRPDRLPVLGRRARDVAVKNFDLPIIGKEMLACYSEIVGRHRLTVGQV